MVHLGVSASTASPPCRPPWLLDPRCCWPRTPNAAAKEMHASKRDQPGRSGLAPVPFSAAAGALAGGMNKVYKSSWVPTVPSPVCLSSLRRATIPQARGAALQPRKAMTRKLIEQAVLELSEEASACRTRINSKVAARRGRHETVASLAITSCICTTFQFSNNDTPLWRG